ncbi:MAG: cyclic nucleotide-binding domain-containing protein [Treponema sp.]|nr:cyclic nucleotide-binding domain-containing protein [Treponema sp.]
MLQLSFVHFKQNSYILIEGARTADRFFIIQSGRAQRYHETQIPGNAPAQLGPGDFVGVIPCMSGHSQTESVVALTDVTAIMVYREQYPDLIVKNTPVAMKIVRTFTREMRMLNNNLTKINLNDSAITSPEMIFSIAKYYEQLKQLDIAVYAYYQYIKESNKGRFYNQAISRFAELRKKTHAVYFEPTKDLVRDYPQNTMIFSEGQRGSDLFIIQDGVVKIVKVVNNSEVTLALLKRGDMFGEMALLDNGLRSASAIAYEPCKLMVVNKGNFNQMVSTQPKYIAKLTTMLADRLWSMYRQLANSQLQESRAKIIDMLALQLENQKVSVTPGIAYKTDYTPKDIIELCGIPLEQESMVIMQFENDQHCNLVDGKIVIMDVPDLIKQATFYRKQNGRNTNGM